MGAAFDKLKDAFDIGSSDLPPSGTELQMMHDQKMTLALYSHHANLQRTMIRNLWRFARWL